MNLAELQNNLIGEWTGNNLLRLSWLTPSDFHSRSRVTISPVVRDKFLTINYTWSHEDTPHEGLIFLGYHNHQKIVTAAWADSWHMSGKLMSCEGTIDEAGTIDVRGFYEAPPDPDWGWRIQITSTEGQILQITMYNCPPEGTEELAVQADYHRAS